MIRAELELIARCMRGVVPPILDVGSSDRAFRGRPKLAYDLAAVLGCSVSSVDAKTSLGVDIAVDVHRLSEAVPAGTINAVICTSLLEHVAQPWLVVAQIATVLRSGGLCLLTAPWVYPEHRDPIDCYRFSVDGLRGLTQDFLLEREAGVLREGQAVVSYWVGEKP